MHAHTFTHLYTLLTNTQGLYFLINFGAEEFYLDVFSGFKWKSTDKEE